MANLNVARIVFILFLPSRFLFLLFFCILNVADVNLCGAEAALAQRGIDYCHRVTQPQTRCVLWQTISHTQTRTHTLLQGSGMKDRQVFPRNSKKFWGRTRKALCGAWQLIVRQLGGGRAWVQRSSFSIGLQSSTGQSDSQSSLSV